MRLFDQTRVNSNYSFEENKNKKNKKTKKEKARKKGT